MEAAGFVTALSGQILLLQVHDSIVRISQQLCSFLDKLLLTSKSQKGSLSLNEAFQKVTDRKKS